MNRRTLSGIESSMRTYTHNSRQLEQLCQKHRLSSHAASAMFDVHLGDFADGVSFQITRPNHFKCLRSRVHDAAYLVRLLQKHFTRAEAMMLTASMLRNPPEESEEEEGDSEVLE